MTVINLSNSENSDLAYKINQFPDGQQDIVISQFLSNGSPWLTDQRIVISSRFNSFKDLELILCATSALRIMGVRDIALYIPYVLGARSDREFIDGGSFYFRDVIAPILNAQNYSWIKCLDPHSGTVKACIPSMIATTNQRLVEWALDNHKEGYVLVSPDAGSEKKIYDLAKTIEYKDIILVGSKHRDVTTGEITHTGIQTPPGGEPIGDKDILIIDDICDGGRTFIELAKEIRKYRTNRIYLIVTHGIFSKGFGELQQYFEGVYTTNSVKDFDVQPFVKQLSVI